MFLPNVSSEQSSLFNIFGENLASVLEEFEVEMSVSRFQIDSIL